jgi:hypothetical protein
MHGKKLKWNNMKSVEEMKYEEEKMNTKIVCLCGSTKFKDDFIQATKDETLKGNIVLSVGLYGHADEEELDSEVKNMLDALHFKKIKMADEILVINKYKYIGASTKREIDYAKLLNKKIKYLE